ncbi:MAG: hypothetical protein NZM31_15800 [Gemmatales bacterium]|nr:hypothetical protein [Gemmatales bacterium]MDW8388462.1 hypothetical protein [Gemmatales bacterium]
MKPSCRYRPEFEALETRVVPSVTYRIVDLNGNAVPDLQIIGNRKNQIVRIIDDPAANRTWISIDKNGNGNFSERGEVNNELLTTTFDVIDVQLKGGQDVFEYHAISEFVGTARELRIRTGSGDDSVLLRINSRISADSLFRATVWLGDGNDRFVGNLVINTFAVEGEADFRVHGGRGKDFITWTRGLPDGADSSTPLNPADVTGLLLLQMYGDRGEDRFMIDFGVAGGFRLHDPGRIQLRADGGSGDDSMLVTFRNTADSNGWYDLQLQGNRGNDLLSFGLFDESNGQVQFENGAVLLDGGNGRGDSGLLSPGQNAPITRANLEN